MMVAETDRNAAERAPANRKPHRPAARRGSVQRTGMESVMVSDTGSVIEAASLLFDPVWYLEQYPDVGAAGVDPVQHFLHTGFAEGRNPNRYFDGSWYARTYPDVAAHGENPFVHYVFYGAREGRRPRAA